MKIAVLGGGHGCYAAVADLSEAGHEVRLWRRDAAALAKGDGDAAAAMHENLRQARKAFISAAGLNTEV